MEILDIHTHHVPQFPFDAIYNSMPGDMLLPTSYYSVGLHPWYVAVSNLQEQKNWLEATVQGSRQVVAIGETGLDKKREIPWDVQLDAFKWQIELAEKVGLPLILHVVNAHNEVIDLKRKYRLSNQWIIHGFRGKKQLAEQYIREGFSLSFGEHYQEDALRATPSNRIFFETDESPIGIHEIYNRAADVLHLPVEDLTKQIQQNIWKVFFNG